MKLLIADDDEQVRSGIQTGIDWRALGIEMVFTACSGSDAFDIFMRILPEIVITDIKMPGIDGLELLEKIKTVAPKTRVIILSGHTDFDYMKAAIKHDAVDYEVKPVRLTYLINLIQKIREDIIRDQTSERDFKEYLNHYMNNFEDDLITGKIKDRLVIREIFARCYSARISGLFVCAILKNSRSYQNDNVELTKFAEKTCQFLQIREYAAQVIKLKSKGNEHAFLVELKARSMLSAHQNISDMADDLLAYNKNNSERGLSIFSTGISSLISDSDFAKSIYEAKQALRRSFYLTNDTVYIYNPLQQPLDEPISGLLLNSEYTSKLNSGDIIAARELIEFEFSRLNNERQYNPERIKEYGIKLLQQIITLVAANNPTLFQLIQQIIGDYKSNQEGFNIDDIRTILLDCLQQVAIHDFEDFSPTIRRAIDYIKNNYTSDLGVEEVAAHIGKSPNYFSHLFKTEYGISFKRYLNKLRIEKAKRLLINTNLMIYEISQAVGYSDFTYFTQVFKKIEGYPPSFLRSQ